VFLLDSLMISGIRWAIETTITAAEAEMNDDSALREQLMAAEMSREMGDISDADFAEIEADLLGRIREIKERKEGGSGPLAFGASEAIEKPEDSHFQVEASVSGDFYNPADAPHTTIIETEPVGHHLAHLIETASGETIEVQDMNRPAPKPRTKRTARKNGTARTARTARTTRTKK
jgi:hypothetical protein